jgi:hypothetical protein
MLSLRHPPYSPDLVPADFFLFPKIKTQLKGRRFHSVGDIQRESQKVMDSLTQNDFKATFQQGRNAVTGALLHKVTISKKMVFRLR